MRIDWAVAVCVWCSQRLWFLLVVCLCWQPPPSGQMCPHYNLEEKQEENTSYSTKGLADTWTVCLTIRHRGQFENSVQGALQVRQVICAKKNNSLSYFLHVGVCEVIPLFLMTRLRSTCCTLQGSVMVCIATFSLRMVKRMKCQWAAPTLLVSLRFSL